MKQSRTEKIDSDAVEARKIKTVKKIDANCSVCKGKGIGDPELRLIVGCKSCHVKNQTSFTAASTVFDKIITQARNSSKNKSKDENTTENNIGGC